MSAITATSGAGAVTPSPQRQQSTVKPDSGSNSASAKPAAAAAQHPAKRQEPIRYFGGIEGMNAANLIVALQAAGTISGGYSAKAIESEGTPPPTIVDAGA